MANNPKPKRRLRDWGIPHPEDATWLGPYEQAIVFPAAGHLDKEHDEWVVPQRVWLFHEELQSIWRNQLAQRLYTHRFPRLDEESNLRFRGRLWPFLVNDLRDRQVVLQPLAEHLQSIELGTTAANGHCIGELRIPAKSLTHQPEQAPIALPSSLQLTGRDQRQFGNEIQLIPPSGISVISDIDDTIKVTRVKVRDELLANTFYRPFKPIPGIAKRYARWAKQGAAFHYVSGTPWQLYPALDQFFLDNRFPKGSIDLRMVRLRDRSLLNLWAAPARYKTPPLQAIIGRYPKRKFVLIGDLSEADAEIYAQLARESPDQIVRIFLRHVEMPENRPAEQIEALKRIYAGLPKKLWSTFYEGHELPKRLVERYT